MTTIQEIFEMRKNGQFEQAYQAVLPMYREHHGHYTTLCMFWTATDVMRLRIESGQCDEAERIFASLRTLYPNLQDRDMSAARTLNRLALLLAAKEQELTKQYLPPLALSECSERFGERGRGKGAFSLLDYMIDFGYQHLSEEDWQSGEYNGHPVPAFGAKVISRIFHEVAAEAECDIDRLQNALWIVEQGLQHNAHNRHLLRYQANLIYRCGNRSRAITLYRQLIRNTRDAYLFSELASIIDDQQQQAALLAKAIQCQRTEVFAQRDRLTLAGLIAELYPQHAAYELQKVVLLRDSLGQHPNRAIMDLQKTLATTTPVSDNEQKEFYHRLIQSCSLAA